MIVIVRRAIDQDPAGTAAPRGPETVADRAGTAASHGPEAVADRAAARLADVTGCLPEGEPRPQQIEMCRAVARSIEGGRHLVVQAGTGTGKSLAYLVPAVLSGRRVVVATATKALQDQLAGKDLPLVARAGGRPFTFAVLKGRSNYLCRQRVAEVFDHGVQPELTEPGVDPVVGDPGDPAQGEPASGADRLVEQIQHIVAWSQRSATGDRADLPFEPHPRAWAMLSVGPRECPGAFRCPSGRECFAEAARAEAAAADVVVVNTHLYGAHLASGGVVLPPHEVVVFDEAHELEEVMTASLGAEVSPGRFRALVVLARAAVTGEDGRQGVDDVAELADRLAGELSGRTGTRVFRPAAGAPEGWEDDRTEPAGRERVLGTSPVRTRPPGGGGTADRDADARLADLLALATARVHRLLALLRRGEQGSLLGDGPDEGPRGRALSAASHLAEDLARLAHPTDDLVTWVDGPPRAPVLRISPIDVGPALSATLWPEVSAVLTSATLGPGLAHRLGLDGLPLDELDVGSPFDYRSHSLLYVARHLPDRRQPGSSEELHRELRALITAAGGRTLALFTSHRATEDAVAALRPELPYRVLGQGELPKGRLLDEFAADETSCLFATLGFWQGVDVPGRALTLVTLDRLPFARPDDPLLEARRERAGDAAFWSVDLPRAATLLAQGAGRLVRSADDYGVVAVLDPRLATAAYRGVLLAALPPMRRTTDRRQVEDFLARVLNTSAASPPPTGPAG
jgi:ATP-dependent DNA helicase DinG